jgi:uncharacterized protein (TIGR02118 family)
VRPFPTEATETTRVRRRYRAAVLAALGTHGEAAIAIARAAKGTALVAVDGQRDPAFASLVLGDGGDQAALESIADIGLYEVTVRPMRHQRRFWPPDNVSPGVTAVFAMVARRDLTHAEADTHWRDVHAPLALRHHPGMWHYHQVSIDRVFAGPEYDGFALCAFASEQELHERFFGGPDDREIITADVASFADTVASPRRVRMLEWRFAEE